MSGRDEKGKFIEGHIPWLKDKRFVWLKSNCKYCGNEIDYPKYKPKEYCNRKCAGKALGFKKGQESWNKGTVGIVKPNSGSFKLGGVSPNKGNKYTEQQVLAMSGPNSPNWKGGVTLENKRLRNSGKFKNWRYQVFARDNWTCQKCEIRGGKLHPHHVNSFADHIEERFDPENGITLCEDCHLKFHRQYGKSQTTSDQISKFIGRRIFLPPKGDVIISSTVNGSTRWTTLWDYSKGVAW